MGPSCSPVSYTSGLLGRTHASVLDIGQYPEPVELQLVEEVVVVERSRDLDQAMGSSLDCSFTAVIAYPGFTASGVTKITQPRPPAPGRLGFFRQWRRARASWGFSSITGRAIRSERVAGNRTYVRRGPSARSVERWRSGIRESRLSRHATGHPGIPRLDPR